MFYFSLFHVGHCCPLAVLLLKVAVHAGDHLGVIEDILHPRSARQLVDRVTDILQTSNIFDLRLEDDLTVLT